MPRTAANAIGGSSITCDQLVALMVSAMQFVARDRGETLIRKWLSRIEMPAMTESRLAAMANDAPLFAADLPLSYPAASGTTAFDRLARKRADAPAAERAAITALCQARFRLLRLENSAAGSTATMASDALSSEAFQILGPNLPPLASGVVLFARVVMLGEAVCCTPGMCRDAGYRVRAIAPGAAGNHRAPRTLWRRKVEPGPCGAICRRTEHRLLSEQR